MLRRFLSWLGIALLVGTIILGVLLVIREQQHIQRFADYSQFSSTADLQSYLSQKLEEGKVTQSEVETFIVQSGIASKISADSNCGRGQGNGIGILCTVRAPVTDYSNEPLIYQVGNLIFEYYHILFEFGNGKLKKISVNLERSF
jgi:hypothetical protein